MNAMDPNEDPEKLSRKSTKKKTPSEILGISQKISMKDIQKHFPALFNELNSKEMSLGISEVEKGFEVSSEDIKQESDLDTDPLKNYDPDVYDFLARAKTDDEGIEIVNFLAKQNQISHDLAQELTEKIKSSGIRSISSERKADYYFHAAAEERIHRTILKRYGQHKDK